MPARIDPFVDVLLRERGEQLYLLPDEPVTMVKEGKSRKVSRQPLTDQHIYALLVEVAPSESADRIDQMAETEFEYVADRGLVRVRIVPEGGRLTAMVAPLEQGTLEFFFFSSRRRHTRFDCDWSSDVCSSDLADPAAVALPGPGQPWVCHRVWIRKAMP